jgi:hypothetical protein
MMQSSATTGKVSHPAPHRHEAPAWLVAAGLIVAPAAWFLQLNASYLLGTSHCNDAPAVVPPDVAYALIVMAGIGAAVLALLGLWATIRTWNLTREEGPGGHADALSSGHGRTRFLALAGFIVSSIFVIAIGFSLIIPILEHTCGA